MKVLITGKNGQVGSSLISQLADMASIDFLALDRAELDITNSEEVNRVITEYRPNIIINAAAYTAVDRAESEQSVAYAINCQGPKNLAVIAKKINAVIIHISTDYVFSGDKEGFYTENDIVKPQCVYGQTKLSGEQAVAETCNEHIILRTAWVFSEYGSNFVKTMLRLAQTHSKLDVVGDQFGGPTYSGDIAAAIINIVEQLQKGSHSYGIYNYTGYPYVSWQEFAVQIFESALANKMINSPIAVNAITTEEYPTPAKRPANSKLDCSKIATDFSIIQSDWHKALKELKKYQ